MITSNANPRAKEVRKLQRRRNRYAAQQIFVEGVRLLRDAWDVGTRPETVFFVADAMAENAEGSALLAALQNAGIDCVPCTAGVFASMSETINPQGIGAVVPMPRLALPNRPTLTLILDRIRDPGNAGTLIRTAEAAGADLVIFASETVDPFNDKVLRAGMGAHFRVPIHVASEWRDVQEKLLDVQAFVADLHAALHYDQVDWRQPSALILGGEARGASNDAFRQAAPITIPMLGTTESLNAAAAGAVILFEAARQRRTACDRA